MTIRWLVDHGDRLICVTATGALTRQDLDSYFAAVVTEGAVGYRALFDARNANLELQPSDLAALSQLVKDRKRDDVSDGSIALLVNSEAEREMGDYFAARTDGERPCRLFTSAEEARAWLKGAPGSKPD